MTKKSGKGRHSYVQFYPSDWMAGTARMPRLVKTVYFDICCYTWDKAAKVPDAEIVLMLADLAEQGDQIVNALVKSGKLQRDDEGNVWSERALAEAERALELWEKKSRGGRTTAGTRADSDDTAGKTPARSAPLEPEPEPEPERRGEEERAHEPEMHGRGSRQLRDFLAHLRAGRTLNDAANVAGMTLGEAELHAQAEAQGEYADVDVPPLPDAKPPRPSRADCSEIMEAWNTMAAKCGLSQAIKMTGSREDTIRVRLEELGRDALLEAIAKVPTIPFLMGHNSRKWRAEFDPFFIRPNSVARILEGKYENGSEESPWRR